MTFAAIAIARWSPPLAWLAPPAAPAGASPDQIVAISRDLAVVRQSVDKLAADVTKLQYLQVLTFLWRSVHAVKVELSGPATVQVHALWILCVHVVREYAVGVRVCPESSGRIAEFSEHEAD